MGVLKKFPQRGDSQIASKDLTQLDLALGRKAQPTDVSDAIVATQPSKLAALRLCCQVSGLEEKEIYGPLDIAAAQWCRIWKGEAYFPNNKEHALMDLCGNEIPLRWDALRRNKELKPLRSELEQRLADALARADRAEQKLETVTEFVKGTQR